MPTVLYDPSKRMTADVLTWDSIPTAARLNPAQEGPARTQAAYEPVSLSTNRGDGHGSNTIIVTVCQQAPQAKFDAGSGLHASSPDGFS
ncbi:hypothetical protein M413DRAFT_26685 [Hebeloma cylindrosporum]|uniref:Uncharacterized protein n=1 Tax=Hebeloma cylindrosporum TaxID=76867 RepID=A0A0C3C1C7_HEBCY|nr:hypothetical protein M413DRAFT_26685 [Hebeloma cylindrosporum h7]